jgi:hypothetical protein
VLNLNHTSGSEAKLSIRAFCPMLCWVFCFPVLVFCFSIVTLWLFNIFWLFRFMIMNCMECSFGNLSGCRVILYFMLKRECLP